MRASRSAGPGRPVLGHLLAAKQLRAKRWLLAGKGRREIAPAGDGVAQRMQWSTTGLRGESHATDVLYVGSPSFGGTGARGSE
jgi:hypothetical protein